MKKLLPILAITLFCSSSARLNAELVSVTIDNMSAPTANASDFFPGGQFTLNRDFVVDVGNVQYVPNVGVVVDNGVFTLTYSLDSGTFENLFDAYKGDASSPFGTQNPNPFAVFGGVGFDIANYTSQGITDVILLVGKETLGPILTVSGDGFYSFNFTGLNRDILANAGQFSLRFYAFDDSFTLTNVSLTAIPEPTALMLVGSVVGLCGFRRRRARLADKA
jgi:hypothetical protein